MHFRLDRFVSAVTDTALHDAESIAVANPLGALSRC